MIYGRKDIGNLGQHQTLEFKDISNLSSNPLLGRRHRVVKAYKNSSPRLVGEKQAGAELGRAQPLLGLRNRQARIAVVKT